MFKTVTAAVAAFAFCLPAVVPLVAGAQEVPSYAQQPNSDDAQVRGRIASFDGGYSLTVRDDRGYVDNVQLHDGTIINPTGLTLAPGMVVSILGYNQGSYFSANEIDTPYNYDGGTPYYGGHPWDYYGPSTRLSFFFGSPGWWHGDYFRGRYHYDNGARIYNSVTVHNVYHEYAPGGEFHGRTFVAPERIGGYRPHGVTVQHDNQSRSHDDRGNHDNGGNHDDHGNRGDHGH